MVKAIIIAASGLSLTLLLSMGPATAQAPPGQRQPTASGVPAKDSVRGGPALAGNPGVAGQTRKKRSRARRVQSNIDVIMKTPNICSNCNQ
jgi:hypothetical protein